MLFLAIISSRNIKENFVKKKKKKKNPIEKRIEENKTNISKMEQATTKKQLSFKFHLKFKKGRKNTFKKR